MASTKTAIAATTRKVSHALMVREGVVTARVNEPAGPVEKR
jgi:hypothetical protein